MRGEGAPNPDARSVGRMIRPEDRGAVGDVGVVAGALTLGEEAEAVV